MVTAHINALWFPRWPCLPLQPVSCALSILHWPALPSPLLPSPLRKLLLCLGTIRFQFIILPDIPSLGSSGLTSGSSGNFHDPSPQSKFCVPFYSSTYFSLPTPLDQKFYKNLLYFLFSPAKLGIRWVLNTGLEKKWKRDSLQKGKS